MGVALGGHVIVCGHGRWDRIDTKSTTSQWDKGGKWIWPQVGLTMHCRLAQSAVTCVLSCCENSSPRFIFCLPFLWRLLLHCFSCGTTIMFVWLWLGRGIIKGQLQRYWIYQTSGNSRSTFLWQYTLCCWNTTRKTGCFTLAFCTGFLGEGREIESG